MSNAVPNRQKVMKLGQDISNVKAIGSEIYNALGQERCMDKFKKISTIHRTNIKGLNTIQKKTVYTEKQIQKLVAGFAYKPIVDITIARGIAIKLSRILNYFIAKCFKSLKFHL